MKYVIFALMLGMSTAANADPARDLAKRLTHAISGKAEFREADFNAQLKAADKQALLRFRDCRVKDIEHPFRAISVDPEVLEEIDSQMVVTYRCDGVPASTPTRLKLHLADGRISTIEVIDLELANAR
jgi:hypothetical protein